MSISYACRGSIEGDRQGDAVQAEEPMTAHVRRAERQRSALCHGTQFVYVTDLVTPAENFWSVVDLKVVQTTIG